MARNTNSVNLVAASEQGGNTTNPLGIAGGTITMEAWIKPNSMGIMTIVHQREVSTSGTEYRINLESGSGGQIRINRTQPGITSPSAAWNSGDISGVWTHVVMTYNGATSTLYTASLGGTHTSRTTFNSSGDGNLIYSGPGFSVGVYVSVSDGTSKSQYFDGLIDEVRVWNDVRTTQELDDNFETELVGNEAGLVAYYKFGSNWNDTTSNGYNLTDIGSATFSRTVPFTGTYTGPFPLNLSV